MLSQHNDITRDNVLPPLLTVYEKHYRMNRSQLHCVLITLELKVILMFRSLDEYCRHFYLLQNEHLYNSLT